LLFWSPAHYAPCLSPKGPGSPRGAAGGGEATAEELAERLSQTEQLVTQLKELIREKDAALHAKDDQLKELTERLRRLQVERESLESKMEAEKHVMRAQLRDLMEKQQAELQRVTTQHQVQIDQTQRDLLGQLEELRRVSVAVPPASQEAPGGGAMLTDSASIQRIAELEAQAKQKRDEASRSEAKFLKMKAWSKTRIRQLEEELKKIQAGAAAPDLTALRSRITALEEEREENLWKVEQYKELKTNNEMLEAKLVVYEEQQRALQADLEQFTKRAASQASESGSADDTQSQVLEWQEMVAEAVSARDRASEEKTAMALRISHIEEEREGKVFDDWFFPGCSDPALATRQQEMEEELAQARGLDQHRAKKLTALAQRSLQEDFEFDGHASFQDPRSTSESTTPMEGENMGGWWPEYSTPDTDGLRSVVEELELERNQLQEQILSLEERCQGLEDRLQLQARIEALQVTFDVNEDEQPFWASQNESEKLQSQVASLRFQQSRDAENHQLLVNNLNEQLKGLTETQECLESSLVEKENTLAKTSEKLELINSLRESLSEKEVQYKEVTDKLLQTENAVRFITVHCLENVSKKCSSSEKQCFKLKTEVADLMQKLTVLKEKTQKQELTIETLQTELDQTSEELDKLNTTHLEERAQLIHDLQSCEREIDSLKDILLEKDKEISVLSGNMVEYAEQITVLKHEIKLKEQNLVHIENALNKAEREAKIIRDSQNSDQQTLNSKITELAGKLKDAEMELASAKEERESKLTELEHLIKQADEDKKTILDLRGEIQKHTVRLVLELKSFKEEHNKLLAQVDKYRSEMQTLSRQLEQQEQSEEHIKRDIQEKLETIASLENQLKANDQQTRDERQKFNSELQIRDSENQKLSDELQRKSENISKLKNMLKSVKTENEQLLDRLKGLNEELELQKQNLKELQEKLTAAVELNSGLEDQVRCLTQEKERLDMKVTDSIKIISEVTAEKDSLLAKISILETQHSQNNKIIEGLQKDKEELTVRSNELNKVLDQSTHSHSEILAKTNECSHLNQLLREREEKVTQLQEQVQSLTSKVDQLQHDMAEKEKTASDLCVHSLTEDNQRLQDELAQNTKSLSDVATERSFLQEKNSGLEIQISDNQKIIDSLLKEKEQLTVAADELRKVLKEGELSHSAGLLEKTSECDNLSKTLREKEEQLQSLHKQAETLKMQVSQLTVSLNEKKQTVTEQRSQLEAQQNQLLQLQDTVSMLQEQGSVLKSGLMEKDMVLQQKAEECSVYQKDVLLQRDLISQMQGEVEALRQERLEANKQIEQKEQTLKELTNEFQKHTDELDKQNNSVISLSSQLSAMNVNAADMEVEVTNLKAAVQKLSAENSQLIQHEDQRKAEIVHLKDSIQALSEQNAKLKSELQKIVMDLSKAQEEVTNLKAAVSDRDKELKTACSERETLNLTMQEKNDCLKQQESLVNQIQLLSTESENLKKMAEETQSAFTHLQEKHAAKLEELQDVKNQLSQRTDEVSSLRKLLDDSSSEHQAAKTAIETLRNELSAIHHKLQKTEDLNAKLLKEKDEVFASHQANVSLLTVEIENQYTAQAKHASQLVSEMQKLEEQNKKLNKEITLLKQEHQKYLTVTNENTHLQQEVRKLIVEKEELERRHHQTWTSQAELQVQMERQSSSTSEIMGTLVSEKERLQAQVSAKDEELFQLRENIQKIEQVLRDSEKEWLLVLDREKQEKNLLAEQLKSLQQAVEERGAVAAQLRAVSQTLRDTQNRCHWLESQVQGRVQGQVQGAVFAAVAPGAPQERSSDIVVAEAAEQSLADERARRETAEEALRLSEDRAKSLPRHSQRDFSIEVETDEEWEALSLNPNQPLITRKVKGGVVACRRWIRGRSLYFSRLLTGRVRSRYFFLAYLLMIHVLVLMCLTGAL
uniref:Golgin B1 n=1 Tax=Monopterus albus TaxID=43700 RepID=A0A3Q3JPH2_MONAL